MPLVNSYFLSCPFCLEQIEIVVDITTGNQEYTEDCEVCCNPILIRISLDGDEVIDIEALREND